MANGDEDDGPTPHERDIPLTTHSGLDTDTAPGSADSPDLLEQMMDAIKASSGALPLARIATDTSTVQKALNVQTPHQCPGSSQTRATTRTVQLYDPRGPV